MLQYSDKKILKKIMKFRILLDPLHDLKDKLEILAVRVGIKPAFLIISDPNSDPSTLELVAKRADLHFKITGRPPDYFPRKPKVGDNFLKIFNNSRLTKLSTIWFYKDVQVELKILESIAGKLNEGHVLGYPECCIKWEEEKSLQAIETLFQEIEEYITQKYPMFIDYEVKTKDQVYEALIDKIAHDELRFKREKAVTDSMVKQTDETLKHYPFVPHWACQSCLSGESKETEKMNNLYKELAINLNPKFAQKIIHLAQES